MPLTLVRLDGELVLSPPKTAANFWQYALKGAATLGHGTPFELQFANLAVTYVAKPGFGEGDVKGHAGADLPVVGGLSIDLAGHQDAKNGLLLDGTQRARLFGAVATNEVLLDNTILADCVTAGNYSSGFDFDFKTLGVTVGCNLGSLHRPNATATAAAVGVRKLSLKLRGGLAGTMLAVRGRGAAPKVLLSGPGEQVHATPGLRPVSGHGFAVYTDQKTHTTYISLLHPRGGSWTVRAAAGSAGLIEVREADPLPHPTISGKLKRVGCNETLAYKVRGRGERILLYAQEAGRRTLLGFAAARSGHVDIQLSGTSGRGSIVALFLRSGRPTFESTLASFSLRSPAHVHCAPSA